MDFILVYSTKPRMWEKNAKEGWKEKKEKIVCVFEAKG